MKANKQQEPYRTLYDRANPPPNKEAAESRSEDLKGIIFQIESQLKHAESDDFEDDDDFRGWRWSAITALGYIVCERDYITFWVLRDEHVAAESPMPACEGPQLMSIRIKHHIIELARELESTYQTEYSDSRLPENVVEARKRLDTLAKLELRTQKHLSTINGLCAFHGIYYTEIKKMKAPLRAVSEKANVEKKTLRAYLEQHETIPHATHGASPEMICAIALSRSIKQGFQVSEAEKSAIDLVLVNASKLAS